MSVNRNNPIDSRQCQEGIVYSLGQSQQDSFLQAFFLMRADLIAIFRSFIA